MQHGHHPRLPPGNDDGGYDKEDIPVIPASDCRKADNHFLTVAVSLSAFSSSSLLLSRAAVVAAG
jgi:hypothetical protein